MSNWKSDLTVEQEAVHFSVLQDIVISLACHSWKSKGLLFFRASHSLACVVDDSALLPSLRVSLGWVSGELSNNL